MKKKNFIITVDTEGDNLWDYKPGTPITTENTRFLPRFQALCNEYGFKPVYLTNYEMASDANFVKMASGWCNSRGCEIGLHLHAWNNPPFYQLKGQYNYNPYLIEYPDEIMREKFKIIHDLLCNSFGTPILSHRAGRWAMDDRYFRILSEFGIKVDCSVTPGIDWSHNVGITRGGSDYTHSCKEPYWINEILEVPMTIRSVHHSKEGSFKHKIKTLIKGDTVWLRPASQSLLMMKKLVDVVEQEQKTDYLEFMIHSSELMPGGSPYFKTAESIDILYDTFRQLFDYVSRKGYVGSTLKEYHQNFIK